MAGIEHFRSVVIQILEKYSQHKPSCGDTEIEVILDTKNDHYQLVAVGWNGQNRIYGCFLHLDIKGDKIWIQHDGTEIGIATDLMAMGISKENIVLGFHSPYKRKYTGFALN